MNNTPINNELLAVVEAAREVLRAVHGDSYFDSERAQQAVMVLGERLYALDAKQEEKI